MPASSPARRVATVGQLVLPINSTNAIFPFIRLGHSNGGGGVAAESAISAGVEVTQSFDQVWTIGAGWAKPSSRTFGPGLDNETVLETSYKFSAFQELLSDSRSAGRIQSGQ